MGIKTDINKGLFLKDHQVPICELTLKKLKKQSIDVDSMRKSIMLGQYNSLTTLYYLTLKK